MFFLQNQTYYYIQPTYINRLPLLYKWWAKLSEVIEQYGLEATETKSVLSAIAYYANLDFEITELNETELSEVLNAIAEVNFQREEKETEETTDDNDSSGESLTLEDYQYQLVTSLVNAELAVDLESALKIASEVPFKDLEGYLSLRIKFLNRDEIADEKAGKELIEELGDGSFWGEEGKSDGFRKGFLKAVGAT